MLVTAFQDRARYRSFVQSFELPLSSQMRAVIFRLLAADVVIREVHFSYSSKSGTTLSIRLSGEPDEDAPPIPCKSPWDPVVLQQLSMFESDGKLVIGPGVRPWFSESSGGTDQ